ncbi:MAG TPA: hypothetical protein VHO91_14280 [Rhodopila sp.]|nr:hypothetical protein [Rhodopila sp.]
MASLLRDPLIQLVMRSDKVSEEDHSELLYRVQSTLFAREQMQTGAMREAV